MMGTRLPFLQSVLDLFLRLGIISGLSLLSGLAFVKEFH